MRVFVVGVLVSGLCFAQSAVLAIRGARVIDGTGTPARPATVLIRGERIEAVGESLPIPAEAHVLDAAGKTLLPGLFDVHTHLPYSSGSGLAGDWGKNLKAYLSCGVTSVADFGAYGEMFEPMRRLLKTGAVIGPRITFAARITSPGGHGAENGWGDFFTLEAATPAEAHAAMRELLPYKPDAIKVFTDGWRYDFVPDLSSMQEPTLAAIVQDAHAAGIKVLTHTVTLEKAKIAARAGVDVLAHGIGNRPVDDELIQLLQASGTTYAPTLAVYEPRDRSQVPPRLEAVLETRILKFVRGADRLRRDFEATSGDSPRNRRWRNLQQNVAALRQAGIPVATGTDAGVTGTYHGWATLRELELLAASGLAPLDVLTIATGGSAKALGVASERGTIEPGKLADLLLIDGKPDQTIADIEQTSAVFLGGAQLDLNALQAAIRSEARTVLPTRPLPALIDDMEGEPGRTRLGTLRVNSSDPGADHSKMIFSTILRKPGDHALMIQARMAPKDRPLVRLELPVTPGAVEPGDASHYSGVSFEARGDGAYHLRIGTAVSTFEAGPEWRVLRIPFPPTLDKRDVHLVAFEIARSAGAAAWLELDNVRFY